MKSYFLSLIMLGSLSFGATTACGSQELSERSASTSTPSPTADVVPPQNSATPEKEMEGERVKVGGHLSFQPTQGYVPNEGTAIKIAEAVWLPIYGEETLKRERPFSAYLEKGIWVVHGTRKELSPGGVAEARISKKTGCILQVIHSM